MTYAIVVISGSQYRVEPEQVIRVSKLSAEEGSTLTLDRVLMLQNDGKTQVGSPTVEGAQISAEVVAHGRTKKQKGGRFQRRKDHRRTWGFREHYTELKIASIQG